MINQPTEENILEAHKIGCENVKLVLETLYPDLFRKELFTGEEACKKFDIGTRLVTKTGNIAQHYVVSDIWNGKGENEIVLIYMGGDEKFYPQQIYKAKFFKYEELQVYED